MDNNYFISELAKEINYYINDNALFRRSYSENDYKGQYFPYSVNYESLLNGFFKKKFYNLEITDAYESFIFDLPGSKSERVLSVNTYGNEDLLYKEFNMNGSILGLCLLDTTGKLNYIQFYRNLEPQIYSNNIMLPHSIKAKGISKCFGNKRGFYFNESKSSIEFRLMIEISQREIEQFKKHNQEFSINENKGYVSFKVNAPKQNMDKFEEYIKLLFKKEDNPYINFVEKVDLLWWFDMNKDLIKAELPLLEEATDFITIMKKNKDNIKPLFESFNFVGEEAGFNFKDISEFIDYLLLETEIKSSAKKVKIKV